MKTTTQAVLSCDCGASARNTTKERGRFLRRHPITPASTDAQIRDHIDDQREMKNRAVRFAAAARENAAKAAVAAVAKPAVGTAIFASSGDR